MCAGTGSDCDGWDKGRGRGRGWVLGSVMVWIIDWIS